MGSQVFLTNLNRVTELNCSLLPGQVQNNKPRADILPFIYFDPLTSITLPLLAILISIPHLSAIISHSAIPGVL